MIHTIFTLLFWIAVGLIFYHLVGYPLLLALLNRVVKNVPRRGDFTPFISVIVPAFNEAGLIVEKVCSILDSDYPPGALEVIVANDGSTDATADQVLALQDERVILETGAARGGKMAALKRGAARARGSYLVITDADVILQPGALRSLMANFADPRVGCVTGRRVCSECDEIDRNENLYLRYEGWIKTQESRLSSTTAVNGVLLAVPRAIFSTPDGIINDDFQMALQAAHAGQRVVYDGGAVAVDKGGSGSLRIDFERKSRVAAGRWQVAGQALGLALRNPGFVFAFVSHKLLRLFIFPLMVVALAANLGAVVFPGAAAGFFRLASPWSVTLLAAQALFYLLAGLGAVLDRAGKRVKPLYFLYYFLAAQIASLGGVVRQSTGRQSVLWRKAAH